MGRGAVALKRMGGKLVSSKSKTGDPQCSAAMSAKVNARHGNPVSMALEVANKILGMCRAKAHGLRKARDHELGGNEAKSQVWAKRAERGLSGKGRLDEARRLKAQRAARPAAAPPMQRAAFQSRRQAAHDLRSNVRQGEMRQASKVSGSGQKLSPGELQAVDRSVSLGRKRLSLSGGVASTPERAAKARALLAERAKSKPAGFSLAQQKGDLPGQTSIFDRVATRATNPQAERLGRLGATHPEIRGMLSKARAGRAAELKAGRAAKPFPEQVNAAATKAKQSNGKALIHHVHEAHQADAANPRMGLDQFKGKVIEHRGKIPLGRADMAHTKDPAEIAKSHTATTVGGQAIEFNHVRVSSPVPAKAPAASRATPERSVKAGRLAVMRKELLSVKADLKHHDEKWAGRAHPSDESRRDRLDEMAAVKRQIARTRGKDEKKNAPEVTPKAAPSKAQLARQLPPLGGGSPMALLQRAQENLARRSNLASRIKALHAGKTEQSHPELHGKPGKTYDIGTEHVHFDPERFQYKLGAQGKHGVTDALKDVSKYDPELAGVVSVWKDPANGKTYVVNGHHRMDLAKRLGVGKVSVKYLHAPDAQTARAKGAMVNIAEGRGTSVDAAKFFRDTGISPADARKQGLSLREQTASHGFAMAGLDNHLFKRVVNQEITPARAAIIGGSGLSHDQQRTLVRLLDKPGNRKLSDGTVSNLVDSAKAAGSHTRTTTDLFGTSEHEESLFIHRAKIEDSIKRTLAADKRLFGLVSKSKAAHSLAERGKSSIDTAETSRVGTESSQVLDVFDHLKHRDKRISEPLNEAAKRIADGYNPKQVEVDARKKIAKHIKGVLDGSIPAF